MALCLAPVGTSISPSLVVSWAHQEPKVTPLPAEATCQSNRGPRKGLVHSAHHQLLQGFHIRPLDRGAKVL